MARNTYTCIFIVAIISLALGGKSEAGRNLLQTNNPSFPTIPGMPNIPSFPKIGSMPPMPSFPKIPTSIPSIPFFTPPPPKN
uniref:Uncharacterized protein n=1 Tax=Solanum lycopersicum TaxID=4081 RepID=A0A3Q7HGF2_SOLLC